MDSNRGGRARVLHRAAVFVTLGAATVVLAAPFYWMCITALKSAAEAAQFPPTWWPREIHVENFAEAWRSAPFARFYFNSIVTSSASAALQMGLAIPMAYAFAWMRAPFKKVLYLAVIATMLVPDEMKLIPNFLLLDQLGWINTYAALIIPPAAHAFPVFVLHQQFLTIPRDLIDAARTDGAGHGRILLSVCLPMSMPMVVAAALVAFLGRWNDLLWPLIATDSASMRTLPVGLLYLQGTHEGGLQWNLLMAACMFVIIPVLGLYAFGQRYFTAGKVPFGNLHAGALNQ